MRVSLGILWMTATLSSSALTYDNAKAEFIRPAESICGIDARPGLQWFKCEVHAGFQFKDTGEIYNCRYIWTNQQSTNGKPEITAYFTRERAILSADNTKQRDNIRPLFMSPLERRIHLEVQTKNTWDSHILLPMRLITRSWHVWAA